MQQSKPHSGPASSRVPPPELASDLIAIGGGRVTEEPRGPDPDATTGRPEECASTGGLLHRGRAGAVLEECRVTLKEGWPLAVIVEGDRGSGKSALLAALAKGCAAPTVLRARCHGTELGFSFGVAGQLLDRLPAGYPAIAAPEGQATDERMLFDRSYRMIREAAARGPVVLAIDDVHLADTLSVRWCSYVARRLDDIPVGLLVSVSPRGWPAGEGGQARADLVADLAALPNGGVVRTEPLCVECAGRLIARRLGRPVNQAFARQCHSLTRGNPQVLAMMADQLAGAADAIPDIALEIAARALASAALSWLRQDQPMMARVVEQFAVCGGRSLETAAMLAGQGEDVAGAARVMLRQIGLLDNGGSDRFAHPAMAEVIASLVAPRERAAMHTQAATIFSQIGESTTLAAEHVMMAGTIGEPWARQLLRQAARKAAAGGDWQRSASYLRRALLEPGPASQTLGITAELGAAEFHYDVGACVRQCAAAAELVADNGDSAAVLAVFANAALAVEDADTAAVFGRLTAALTGASLPERDALLRLAASTVLCGQALLPEQAAGVRQAMRRLVSGPRDMAARQLLSALALASAARGRGQRRSRLLALRSAAGGPVRFNDPVPSTAACTALALAWAGEMDMSSDTCAQAVEAARRMMSRTDEALALLVHSEIALARGDLTSALNDAHQAFQLFEMVGATGLQAAAAAALTRVRLLRGGPGATPGQASGPALRASGHPLVLAMQQEARGMLAEAQGNRTLALRLYLECGRNLMAAGLVNPACSAWRSHAVVALVSLGRTWEARTLADSEIKLARSWGAPGPLGRALAAAAKAYDGRARRELLTEAVTVLEGSGHRLHLARALIQLGLAMHADLAEPDRAASEMLERGLDLAMDCGAVALVTTVNGTMRAAGTPARELQASRVLTAAERRVAELVVTGMSNQAAAISLTLSKRTVDTHLGRIYRKLGITGRAQLREVISDPAAHGRERQLERRPPASAGHGRR